MEETLELAKTLGRVDQEDWARLELLCRAAEAELKHWLRPGVTEADCGEAFPLAAAWLALAGLEEEMPVERFSAGDVTIQTGSAASRRSGREALARRTLRPWLRDEGFRFRGVRG